MQLSFTHFNYLQLYPIAKSITKHVIAPPPPPLKKSTENTTAVSEISNVGVNQMSKHFMWNHYSRNCCLNSLLKDLFWVAFILRTDYGETINFVSVTFKSQDKMLRCYHSNETACAELLHSFIGQDFMNILGFLVIFLFCPLLWLSDFLEVSLTSQWFLHPIRKIEFWC